MGGTSSKGNCRFTGLSYVKLIVSCRMALSANGIMLYGRMHILVDF